MLCYVGEGGVMEPMKKLFNMLKIVGDGSLSDSTKFVFPDYTPNNLEKV
jgi:hypothetical protein